MTRIVTNNLLQPTRRVISNVNSVFMTSDGPNLSAKIDLVNMGIPYDSHYRSRIVLPANTNDYFLHYGTLENVTFLLIKVTYNGNYDFYNEDDFDPLYRYEPNNYNINYYFEGNSGITYPIGRLLVLNGSFTTPLTKIYLNNPLDYDVVLDVLHANIDPPKLSPTSSAITFPTLFYTNIITNTVSCNGSTGSTSFIITDNNTYYLEVPYITILSIVKNSSTDTITLTTTNRVITLKFLTEFDFYQAYSRMMFAYSSYPNIDCRYMEEEHVYLNGNEVTCITGFTGIDIVSPIIYYNSSSNWTGSGTTVPTNVKLHYVHNGITGWTSEQLKYLFISGITDCWDGVIPITAVTMDIYKKGSTQSISGITEEGIYNIVFSYYDNANNSIINYITDIYVDDTPPVIVLQYGVLSSVTGNTTSYSGITGITSGVTLNSGFTFNLSGFSSGEISRLDIIDNVIDHVYDNVDTSLNKYMLNVRIISSESGGTLVTSIIKPGYYLVEFSISDNSGNQTIEYYMLNVLESIIFSCFSSGIWRDNKIWIDTTTWLDYPV